MARISRTRDTVLVFGTVALTAVLAGCGDTTVVADRDGIWLAGRDGPAAMIMPAMAKVGDVFRPENICGVVFEEVTVQSVGVPSDIATLLTGAAVMFDAAAANDWTRASASLTTITSAWNSYRQNTGHSCTHRTNDHGPRCADNRGQRARRRQCAARRH